MDSRWIRGTWDLKQFRKADRRRPPIGMPSSTLGIEKKTAKLQGSERSVVARLEAGHAVVGTAVASHAAMIGFFMARTGLMISILLLYLKFFPTAKELINYYNQKRCTDGKGLVLPGQIVTYLEPAQVSEVEVINCSNVNVKATPGLVLGPPWQRLENRYLVSSPQGQSTLYYEPYCVYDQNSLGKECAVRKFHPKFTLVSAKIGFLAINDFNNDSDLLATFAYPPQML
ncbi:Phosphatidylinositol 3,4,5-trisphosphate 3-phosphatase and protein-tyrosine-phosphatase PTEN2A, partial [Linum perenne]